MAHHKHDKWPRTIPFELFQAWEKHRRRGDGVKMTLELGYSRPVIDRAINYGYVRVSELTDLITQWLLARVKKEQEGAAELNDLDRNPNKKKK